MREAFRFYCYSDDELVDLFERFRTEFPTTEEGYVHDCENVWEWFEGKTSDQLISFNIHRPHIDLDEFGVETMPNPECPVCFVIELSSMGLSKEKIGAKLAVALKVDVFCGVLDNSRDKHFVFHASETFPFLPRR